MDVVEKKLGLSHQFCAITGLGASFPDDSAVVSSHSKSNRKSIVKVELLLPTTNSSFPVSHSLAVKGYKAYQSV